VVGVGRRESSLRQALSAGAVDEVTLDAAAGVSEADLVVLATPISAFGPIMPALAEGMKPGALLSDVASTKQGVIRTITRALKGRPDVVYIPTHPMAGSEKRGPESAVEGLFEGSVCIFTPLDGTPKEALTALRKMWEAVGARVHIMDAAAHDRLVARISHLPHLVAAALMRVITPEEGAFAGGGLIDTSRVASGDPKLWRDICESNAPQIAAALKACAGALETLRGMLEEGRFDELEEALREAKLKRDGLIERRSTESQ